jgi:hypothetical protein
MFLNAQDRAGGYRPSRDEGATSAPDGPVRLGGLLVGWPARLASFTVALFGVCSPYRVLRASG